MIENLSTTNIVNYRDLCNDYTWTIGPNGSPIITIFIISIQSPQLKFCLDAINSLNVNCPVKINVIMNISPTSRAYDTMVERCTTDFFIQLDEDMELFPSAINNIMYNIDNMKRHKNMCYMRYYYLIDDYLGVGTPPTIIGLKIYTNKIMRKYRIDPDLHTGTNIASSVDNLWHKKIHDDGYVSKQISEPIGFHAKHRLPFDIMLRFCKMTKSILDERICSHRSDKPKIVKPFHDLENAMDIYGSIIQQFILLGFSIDMLNKNADIVEKFIGIIPRAARELYGINVDPIVFKRPYPEPESFIPVNLHTIPLGENMINVKHIYGIIGIVNTLFENYQYSHEHYPFSIDDYFKNIFQFNIVAVCDDDIENSQKITPITLDLPPEFVNVVYCTTDLMSYTCIQNNPSLVIYIGNNTQQDDIVKNKYNCINMSDFLDDDNTTNKLRTKICNMNRNKS